MITTRFAPGVSGPLHVGSILNAVVNWHYARRRDGRFLVRFDGTYIGPEATALRDSYLRDLDSLGLSPDAVYSTADHWQELRSAARAWILAEPSAYACYCTPQQIAERALAGAKPERVDRFEKYPPLGFAVSEIVAIDAAGTRIRPTHAESSHVARGDFILGPKPGPETVWEPKNVLTDGPEAWRPFSCGYALIPFPRPAALTVKFEPNAQEISEVQIAFPTGVPRRLSIQVITVAREVETFHDELDSYATPENWDTQEIRRYPVNVSADTPWQLRILFHEGAPWYMRPYHYDGACDTEENHKPDSKAAAMDNAAEGVIRLSNGRHPTAVWFDSGPDLAWLSPWIDRDLGVTHVLRGEDLRPFTRLEDTVAEALGYERTVLYHPVVCSTSGAKWSKTLGAPRALDRWQPEELLGILASLLGFKLDNKPITAAELLALEPRQDPDSIHAYRTESAPCGLPLLLP